MTNDRIINIILAAWVIMVVVAAVWAGTLVHKNRTEWKAQCAELCAGHLAAFQCVTEGLAVYSCDALRRGRR